MSERNPLPLDAATRDELARIVEEVRAARYAKPFDPQRWFAACREYDERFDPDSGGYETVLALLASVRGAEADTARLDWLEAMLNIGSDPVEVFFAGLRSDINLMRPDAIQVEMESASKTYHRVHDAPSLRAAIDAARAHPPTKETDDA